MNNTAATVGFVFSLLAVCFGWAPYLGGILWVIGAILSFTGIARPRNGLAWAGLIISFVWIVAYCVTGFLFGSFVWFTIYPCLIL